MRIILPNVANSYRSDTRLEKFTIEPPLEPAILKEGTARIDQVVFFSANSISIVRKAQV
jgi:hypothetical protein